MSVYDRIRYWEAEVHEEEIRERILREMQREIAESRRWFGFRNWYFGIISDRLNRTLTRLSCARSNAADAQQERIEGDLIAAQIRFYGGT